MASLRAPLTAPRRHRRRALGPAVGLAVAAMAGASTGPTHAQLSEEALVYEKWLDLRLNPAHAAPPAPVGGPGGGVRVVHGRESQRGAWPSVANIGVVKDGIGRSTCGGTLIGRR